METTEETIVILDVEGDQIKEMLLFEDRPVGETEGLVLDVEE